MINEVIVVYAIVDDLLKAIRHQEDVRIQMSDAEIITSAIIATMFFWRESTINISLHERT
jgi:hypothetical protein